ncbi:MAG: GntR family transcriptional regulator [Xanthomonadales bacterium]|nr:GntR family transcriptional regulator [Gammaproteobacteria bacterium]MBT8054037.1 GntR family transcriptional regulator [Gammaproteobacteria bacterium]NND57432.1 GntR family transcriptional regulator [Xanthomonadales bacterium]NNK50361.1 GntR family transcriptional regulator [Xanthomonadales bacterium]
MMSEQTQSNQDSGAADAEAGTCVLLKAINTTRAGTFMEWREGRDLLVPISQQLAPMQRGKSYLVYLLLDPDERMIGSTKLHRYLSEDATPLKLREKVDLVFVGETDLGYKAVVNGTHLGLLFKDEAFETYRPGDTATGYIKSIREDRKINLTLKLHERNPQDELSERILDFLKARKGVSTLTDYSPPHAIYKQFQVSKAKYKKALGRLYKKRLIKLEKDKITLLAGTDQDRPAR